MAESRPRIPPRAEYDEQVDDVLSKTLSNPEGLPSNVFTTLAHHPRLLERFNALGGLFMTRSELSPRERELVILRVATRTGCHYEWGQHVQLAREAGLTAAELSWLAADGVPHDGKLTHEWSPVDTTLITVADRLVAGREIGARLWKDLTRDRSEAQVLELLMLVGFYRMLAGMLNAVGVELDAGLPRWPAIATEAVDADLTVADLTRLTAEVSATDGPRDTTHTKAFNAKMIEALRAGGGRLTGEFAGRSLLILTTVGRRSGRRVSTPLRYHRVGGRLFVVASMGGAPEDPQWFRNVLADPSVVIDMEGDTVEAHAVPTEGAERDEVFAAIAEALPVFVDYQSRTDRTIPVVELRPVATGLADRVDHPRAP